MNSVFHRVGVYRDDAEFVGMIDWGHKRLSGVIPASSFSFVAYMLALLLRCKA